MDLQGFRVGGFNPLKKYESNCSLFPKFRDEIWKNVWVATTYPFFRWLLVVRDFWTILSSKEKHDIWTFDGQFGSTSWIKFLQKWREQTNKNTCRFGVCLVIPWSLTLKNGRNPKNHQGFRTTWQFLGSWFYHLTVGAYGGPRSYPEKTWQRLRSLAGK